VSIKQFVDGLLQNYPQSMHPNETGIKDLLRTIRSLKYTEKQLDMVYDETLKRSKFFPMPYNVIDAAAGLNFQTTGQRPSFDIAWRTWEDGNGRCWAQKKGHIQPESGRDYEDRLRREACSSEEGAELFKRSFFDAGGKSLPGKSVLLDPGRLLPGRTHRTPEDASPVVDVDPGGPGDPVATGHDQEAWDTAGYEYLESDSVIQTLDWNDL